MSKTAIESARQAMTSLYSTPKPVEPTYGYSCSYTEVGPGKINISVGENSRIICSTADGRSFDLPSTEDGFRNVSMFSDTQNKFKKLAAKILGNRSITKEDQDLIVSLACRKGSIDPLMEAAYKGDLGEVKQLLEEKVSSKSLNDYKYLLLICAHKNNEDLLKFIAVKVANRPGNQARESLLQEIEEKVYAYIKKPVIRQENVSTKRRGRSSPVSVVTPPSPTMEKTSPYQFMGTVMSEVVDELAQGASRYALQVTKNIFGKNELIDQSALAEEIAASPKVSEERSKTMLNPEEDVPGYAEIRDVSNALASQGKREREEAVKRAESSKEDSLRVKQEKLIADLAPEGRERLISIAEKVGSIVSSPVRYVSSIASTDTKGRSGGSIKGK